jgi:hypothetical protein
MDKAEEFINQEETLRAILGLDPSRVSTCKMPKKEKKVNPKENSTNFKPRKKFKESSFTPFNASITKVLMEVKKDAAYQKPPRYSGSHQLGPETYIVPSTKSTVIASKVAYP